MLNVKMYAPNKYYAVDTATGRPVAEGTTPDEALANAQPKPVKKEKVVKEVVEKVPAKRGRKAAK